MSENKRCPSCGQLNEPDKDGIYRVKCWYCKNDIPDTNVGDMPEENSDAWYCPNCKVPGDRHGTACGWMNARFECNPEGIITTEGHPFKGKNFNEIHWEHLPAPTKEGATQQSTPEAAIPEEIIVLAQKMGDNYSEYYEKDFSPRSATAGRECALEMYRHLQSQLSSIKGENEHLRAGLEDKALMISSNVPPGDRDGISPNWIELWSEVERWYGDIKKKETGRQFLLRMQARYSDAPLRVLIEAMTADRDLYRKESEDANQFIRDIGKLLGEDGLGLDGLSWTTEEFKEACKELRAERDAALKEVVELRKIHQEIDERHTYLRAEENKAINELDLLAAGSIERQAKWLFIREFCARRNELWLWLKKLPAQKKEEQK